MSFYYMEFGKPRELVYDDGMTKQSFKDSADIDKIIAKAQISGGLSHAMKYDQAVYGEFQGYDLLEAYTMVEKAKTIFNDLPSEVRNEFAGDAFAFAEFASNPENIGRLADLIPAIAAPGRYFPNPVARQEPPAGVSTPAPAVAPLEPDKGSGGV